MYKLLQDFFNRISQEERINWLTYIYESEDEIIISFIQIDDSEEAPE